MSHVERPDVGGILHLEHVNFTVPGQDLITLFFISGLGLTRDPYKRTDETNFGVNVGLQQFHLPTGGATPPFPGLIRLVSPDIDGIVERLERVAAAGKFDGSTYRLERRDAGLLVTTPFGPRLHIDAPSESLFHKPLGIHAVDLPVPPGTASGVAAYYREIYHAPAHLGELEGRPAAFVTMGANQTVAFYEDAPDGFDFDYRSFHLAFYTARYDAVAARLAARPGSLKGHPGLVMFFSTDIFDPGTGERLVALENEVRSAYHADFMRPLVNRWPLVAEPFTDQFQSRKDLKAEVGFTPGAKAPAAP